MNPGKEYMHRWRINNPDKVKASYMRNRESILARKREWYYAHKTEISERLKARYAANPEPTKARIRKYYRENRSAALASKRKYRKSNGKKLAKLQMKRYYKYHQKHLKKLARYRAKNRDKIRKYSRDQAALITPTYAREQLSKYSPLSSDAWPAALVEAKIETIKLKRLLKTR